MGKVYTQEVWGSIYKMIRRIRIIIKKKITKKKNDEKEFYLIRIDLMDFILK